MVTPIVTETRRHGHPVAQRRTESVRSTAPVRATSSGSSRGGRCSGVTEDIEHFAARIAHEEPADAPGLIGQRMNDLATEVLRSSVGRVHIVDLDRSIRCNRGGGVLPHYADLS